MAGWKPAPQICATENEKTMKSKRRKNSINPLFLILLVFIAPIIIVMVFNLQSKPRYRPPFAPKSDRYVVYSLSFPANDNYALAGGNHSSAWILDTSSGEVVKRFAVKSEKVVSTDITPDGKTIALCEEDGTINLWDGETNKLIASHSLLSFYDKRSLNTTSHTRFRIALSPDASQLLVNDMEKDFRLLDSRSGQTIQVFDAPKQKYILWFDFTPDGKKAITIDSPIQIVQVNDLETKTSTQFPIDSIEYCTARITPDGKNIVLGGKEGFIRIVDLTTGKSTHFFCHPEPVSALEISSDGSRLLVGGINGIFSVWNLISFRLITTADREPSNQKGASQPILGLNHAGEGENVFVMDRTGKYWSWDGHSNQCRWIVNNVTSNAKREIVSSEKTIPAPAPIADMSLLDKPIDRVIDFKEQGIDTILESVQSITGIPIDWSNLVQIQFLHQDKITYQGKSVTLHHDEGEEPAYNYLEEALTMLSLSYVIQNDGTIHLGKIETLAQYSKNASPKKLSDIPKLQTPTQIDRAFLYISDVVKAINPQNSMNFTIEDEPFPKISLRMENPTPRQILEAVLTPNGLDYSLDYRKIYIGKEKPCLECRKQIAGTSQPRSAYGSQILNQILPGIFQADHRSLREILEELRTNHQFTYKSDADLSAAITVQLQSPTVAHLLDSILPPLDLAYALQSDGVIRIDRIEEIEKGSDLIFSPQQLASFLIQYHSRFRTTQLTYSGTDRSGEPVAGARRVEQETLYKDAERVLKLREQYSQAPDLIKSNELTTLMDYFHSVSDDDLKRIVENKKNLSSGLTRDATRVYTVEGNYRRLDVRWPGTVPDAYYVLLNEKNQSILEFQNKIYPQMFGMAKWDNSPDHPFRMGADLDWFLQRGNCIMDVDWDGRKIRIERIGDATYNKTVYEFTLLNGHTAYWKQCDTLKEGRVIRRILCSDFVERSGLWIPQSVQVQDIYGDEFYYLDSLYYQTGQAIPLSSQNLIISSGGYRYDYAMKLVDAKVNQVNQANQPVEKKP